MRLLDRLGTLVTGLCMGYILSGVMGLLVSRSDAIKVAVASVVAVAACSFMSGFSGKQPLKKKW